MQIRVHSSYIAVCLEQSHFSWVTSLRDTAPVMIMASARVFKVCALMLDLVWDFLYISLLGYLAVFGVSGWAMRFSGTNESLPHPSPTSVLITFLQSTDEKKCWHTIFNVWEPWHRHSSHLTNLISPMFVFDFNLLLFSHPIFPQNLFPSRFSNFPLFFLHFSLSWNSNHENPADIAEISWQGVNCFSSRVKQVIWISFAWNPPCVRVIQVCNGSSERLTSAFSLNILLIFLIFPFFLENPLSFHSNSGGWLPVFCIYEGFAYPTSQLFSFPFFTRVCGLMVFGWSAMNAWIEVPMLCKCHQCV